MKARTLGFLLALAPGLAPASVLTGDTVTFAANPGVVAPTPALVGAGNDLVFQNFQFDFDALAGANGFTWIAVGGGGSLAGSTSITISDMDFTDGSVLVGFDLDSTLLSGLTIATTADSITFSYTSTGIVGPGTIISGEYITAAVPAPATLPLALGGLALLGVFSRRRARHS